MKNKNTTLSLDDQISWKWAIGGGVMIAVVASIFLAGAWMFHKARQAQVISKYTTETLSVVNNHQPQFEALFTDTFDACRELLFARRQASPSAVIVELDCDAARQQLAAAKVNEFRDSSAVTYIKVADKNIEVIEASGKFHAAESLLANPNSYSRVLGYGQNRQDLTQYLLDGKPAPMWADYVTYIPGKEVVVPIKKGDAVIGYIFRGVIER